MHVGSVAGVRAGAGQAVYAASKAGAVLFYRARITHARAARAHTHAGR